MLNDLQIAKIQQFANDRVMNEAVLKVIRGVFARKSKDRDVNNLAANFIAIEKLEEVRAEIDTYRSDNKKEEKTIGNVGV